MSKRFGRSQRRAAREKIAKLEAANEQLRRECQVARVERERALRETRDVVKAVEEIAPMSAAIEPRLEQLGHHADRLQIQLLVSQGRLPGGHWGSPFSNEPISAETVVLNRLSVQVVADHVRKALYCQARIEDTGELEMFVTEDAFRATRAREFMVRHVAEKLVAGFAKGIHKLAIGPKAGP